MKSKPVVYTLLKTISIYPAILLHALFNLVGTV